MMMELTRDSTEQYKQLGVFTESGGIEVARTPERMIELRRRCTAAKAWDIPAELMTPAQVRELVPFLDDSVIIGGAYFPTVGVVDSLRAGTLMREHAQAAGALTVLANTEITRHRHGAGRSGRGRPGGPRHRRPDHRRRHRDRDVRDLLRRLVAAAGGDGGRHDRADPDRAPDDQRRADRDVRRIPLARSATRSSATST